MRNKHQYVTYNTMTIVNIHWASLVAQMVKNLPPICRRPMFSPWVGKIPWRREGKPPPAFLPRESPWTEEPGGYSPWGCKESDTTEWLSACAHTHTHTHTMKQWSSIFLALGTNFVEDNFSTDQGRECFQDDSRLLHLLCTLFLLLLHQVNLRLSSIKFWRLGTLMYSIFKS